MSRTIGVLAMAGVMPTLAHHSFAAYDLGKTESAQAGPMSRAGFSPKDRKRGEKVEIVWHPLRNGSLGGSLSSI